MCIVWWDCLKSLRALLSCNYTGRMSDRKYFLDCDNRPRFPWYGNKYFGDPIHRANTKPWRKQMRRERKEIKRSEKREESRKKRAFKTVAGQIVTGNKVPIWVINSVMKTYLTLTLLWWFIVEFLVNLQHCRPIERKTSSQVRVAGGFATRI